MKINLFQNNQSKVNIYHCIMALTIEDSHSELYIQKYYLVKYKDESEMIFMTTNELDTDYNKRILDEDFLYISSIKQLLDEFGQVNVNFHGFNSPPKYIDYEIVFIDNKLKSIFLKHLTNSISGYTEADFTQSEIQRINYWFSCLKK